ncbi:PRTRC system ThiF family protein [Chryseobacterium aureum]|uniref:PRTRC system ThiF family protein n=1 Tax=Chryseobacterium aureum TaxID=2497456 RepID=UPI000F872DB3|nr:PRTRC system ThiF family protein [Chryseobacterium aureum]
MMNKKNTVHFTDNSLISPTNPVSVNLIGAGGTGSKVLTSLIEMNHSLIELGHAGLQVSLWDDDVITGANLGRQRFAECETGLYKSVALINRANRWSGTNWKAQTVKFSKDNFMRLEERSVVTITCVDNVRTRFDVGEILNKKSDYGNYNNEPKYWLDFGNSKDTGQVLLSTVGDIKQPNSEKYETVSNLPYVTEEFGELLKQSEYEDDMPSCSLAQALEKQDLYINSALAQMGSSLLWGLFRNGLTENRGFFLNLKNFHSQPIKVA